jgi:hypothetical protein
MIWGLFALIAGLTYCAQTEINRTYKVKGFTLNTFRSLFAALFMIPIIPFMEWPDFPEYYLVVVLEASIGVVCMMAQYNIAAKKNGRVACLHQPIALLLTFVFWLILEEGQRQTLLQNPINTAGIAASFLIFIFSIQYVRKNNTGWSALLAVIPIAVLYSIMTVVSKMALESGDSLLEISLNFVFLCNVVMFIISLPVYYVQNKKNLIPEKIIISAGSIAFFHTISWVFVCIAIILTPNPAYVLLLTSLTPVWFMVYYKFRGIPDDASPWAGLFITLSAIMMLIFSK